MSSRTPSCAVNIGPREQQKRRVAGLVVLGLGVGLGVALLALGTQRAWRALLFVPFVTATISLLQAREKT